MADITPIASLKGEISPIASLTGQLAMPEKVWMQGPKGDPGAAATVMVGTVTTGEPGTDAVVINSGTESAAVLDFTIPKGENGAGVPDGGTIGQLLSKTETGTIWIDPPQSRVQPDWNQNDETQPDFVKNRPFYTGNPVNTVFVEESTVSFAAENGVYMGQLESTFSATGGETYKVSWDGTVYECVCVEMQGHIFIGNLAILGPAANTGEPFLMAVNNGRGLIIGTTDTSASHTFSISGIVTEVVKIDGKYLIQSDWDQNDETAADYVKNRPFYDEIQSVTVEGISSDILEGSLVFAVGDTVTVTVDGVEHSLVAYDEDGYPIIGDTYSSIENGEGQFGWQIYVDDSKAVQFYAKEAHTVSYFAKSPVKINEKYLPDTIATKSDVKVVQTAADNAKAAADNAKAIAGNAQSLAYAKFQLMKQTTVKTTTTIGTVRNSIGSVNVKGLNIAVGSIIKFTADGNASGSAVWDRPEKVIDIKNSHGVTLCNLNLALLHDGQTYSFTNQTAGSILSNLVIEYEKVIIPTSAFTSRMEGAWLPPYLIANCLYLTKASTTSTSAKLYRITIDDTGTLKATEVTS